MIYAQEMPRYLGKNYYLQTLSEKAAFTSKAALVTPSSLDKHNTHCCLGLKPDGFDYSDGIFENVGESSSLSTGPDELISQLEIGKRPCLLEPYSNSSAQCTYFDSNGVEVVPSSNPESEVDVFDNELAAFTDDSTSRPYQEDFVHEEINNKHIMMEEPLMLVRPALCAYLKSTVASFVTKFEPVAVHDPLKRPDGQAWHEQDFFLHLCYNNSQPEVEKMDKEQAHVGESEFLKHKPNVDSELFISPILQSHHPPTFKTNMCVFGTSLAEIKVNFVEDEMKTNFGSHQDLERFVDPNKWHCLASIDGCQVAQETDQLKFFIDLNDLAECHNTLQTEPEVRHQLTPLLQLSQVEIAEHKTVEETTTTIEDVLLAYGIQEVLSVKAVKNLLEDEELQRLRLEIWVKEKCNNKMQLAEPFFGRKETCPNFLEDVMKETGLNVAKPEDLPAADLNFKRPDVPVHLENFDDSGMIMKEETVSKPSETFEKWSNNDRGLRHWNVDACHQDKEEDQDTDGTRVCATETTDIGVQQPRDTEGTRQWDMNATHVNNQQDQDTNGMGDMEDTDPTQLNDQQGQDIAVTELWDADAPRLSTQQDHDTIEEEEERVYVQDEHTMSCKVKKIESNANPLDSFLSMRNKKRETETISTKLEPKDSIRLLEESAKAEMLALQGGQCGFEVEASKIPSSGPLATDSKHTPFTIVCSTEISQSKQLLCMLEARYSIFVKVRDFTKLGSQINYADVTISHTHCAAVLPLRELSQAWDMEQAVRRYLALGLQYSYIYIVAHCIGVLQGYSLGKEAVSNLSKLRASLSNLNGASDNFNAHYKILICQSEEDVAVCIRKLADMYLETHTETDIHRSWVSADITRDEEILLRVPCINPLSAQMLLHKLNLNGLLDMSVEDLRNLYSDVPSSVLKHFKVLTSGWHSVTQAESSSSQASMNTTMTTDVSFPSSGHSPNSNCQITQESTVDERATNYINESDQQKQLVKSQTVQVQPFITSVDNQVTDIEADRNEAEPITENSSFFTNRIGLRSKEATMSDTHQWSRILAHKESQFYGNNIGTNITSDVDQGNCIPNELYPRIKLEYTDTLDCSALGEMKNHKIVEDSRPISLKMHTNLNTEHNSLIQNMAVNQISQSIRDPYNRLSNSDVIVGNSSVSNANKKHNKMFNNQGSLESNIVLNSRANSHYNLPYNQSIRERHQVLASSIPRPVGEFNNHMLELNERGLFESDCETQYDAQDTMSNINMCDQNSTAPNGSGSISSLFHDLAHTTTDRDSQNNTNWSIKVEPTFKTTYGHDALNSIDLYGQQNRTAQKSSSISSLYHDLARRTINRDSQNVRNRPFETESTHETSACSFLSSHINELTSGQSVNLLDAGSRKRSHPDEVAQKEAKRSYGIFSASAIRHKRFPQTPEEGDCLTDAENDNLTCGTFGVENTYSSDFHQGFMKNFGKNYDGGNDHMPFPVSRALRKHMTHIEERNSHKLPSSFSFLDGAVFSRASKLNDYFDQPSEPRFGVEALGYATMPSFAVRPDRDNQYKDEYQPRYDYLGHQAVAMQSREQKDSHNFDVMHKDRSMINSEGPHAHCTNHKSDGMNIGTVLVPENNRSVNFARQVTGDEFNKRKFVSPDKVQKANVRIQHSRKCQLEIPQNIDMAHYKVYQDMESHNQTMDQNRQHLRKYLNVYDFNSHPMERDSHSDAGSFIQKNNQNEKIAPYLQAVNEMEVNPRQTRHTNQNRMHGLSSPYLMYSNSLARGVTSRQQQNSKWHKYDSDLNCKPRRPSPPESNFAVQIHPDRESTTGRTGYQPSTQGGHINAGHHQSRR